MGKFVDLTGKTFGSLVVQKRDGYTQNGKKIKWLCLCDPALGGCGQTSTPTSSDLNSGHSQSCGCVSNEIFRLKHGAKQNNVTSKTYSAWISMKQRCQNPKNRDYSLYGGRGISICNRWLEPDGQGFLNFLADLGEVPKGLTLDRINSNGHYEPGNCRWINQAEQCRNTSRNRLVTLNGEAMLLADWARRLNVGNPTLWRWLKKGLAYEEILSRSQVSQLKRQQVAGRN